MKIRIFLNKGRWTWMFPPVGSGTITHRQVCLAANWCFMQNHKEGR